MISQERVTLVNLKPQEICLLTYIKVQRLYENEQKAILIGGLDIGHIIHWT